MYSDKEVLVFDGTVQGLTDQLDLLKATMPKRPAFVYDSAGNTLTRLRVTVQSLSDGSRTWDVKVGF